MRATGVHGWPRGRRARASVIIASGVLVSGLFVGAGHGATIERRGREAPLSGEIAGLTDDGVTLDVRGDRQFVPWDRIRDVKLDEPDPTLPRRLRTATELWRARSRVERGDHGLAEPLFDRLFAETRGDSGETPLVVAEGLLRCRLARGASIGAVIPWLEVTRLRRAGMTTASYADRPAVGDAVTELCPQLAPAWVQSRALVKLERDLAEYDAQRDPVVAALASGYRAAVRRQLGLPSIDAPGAPDDASVVDDHAGVRMVATFLDATGPDSAVRESTRTRLRASLPAETSWHEAWMRFALGASLLHETGAGRQRRGIVELVHLPVRFTAETPYLAGLAGGWIIAASRAAGDDATADVVQQELYRQLPDHPVLSQPHPVRLPSVEISGP